MLEILSTYSKLSVVKKISYCHWKSNIDIDIALNGDTDLDILVAKDDLAKLLELFLSLDIREVRSWYHQQYPGIRDFIGYDEESTKIVHFHLHVNTILGRSGLKELHVPLERALLDNTEDYDGFTIVSPEIEMVVFLIRLSAKTNLTSRMKQAIKKLLGRTHHDANRKEFEYLMGKLDHSKLETVLGDLGMEKQIESMILEIVSAKKYPDAKTLSKLYRALRPYRRFSFAEQYVILMLKRLFSKYITLTGLKGKEMMSGGHELAILGMDGAGKSTLADALHKILSYKIRTEKVYLGSSDASWTKKTFFALGFPFLALGKILGSEKLRFMGWYIVEIGYFYHRRSKYLRGKHASRRGSVVIYERFPVDKVSDFPFLTYRSKKGSLSSRQSQMVERLRKRYRETFALPEAVIALNVPLNVAVDRKKDHDTALLEMKHARFSDFVERNEHSEQLIVLDASMPQDALTRKVMNYIWKSLL